MPGASTHIRILSKFLIRGLLKVIKDRALFLSSQEVQVPAGGKVIIESLLSSLYFVVLMTRLVHELDKENTDLPLFHERRWEKANMR